MRSLYSSRGGSSRPWARYLHFGLCRGRIRHVQAAGKTALAFQVATLVGLVGWTSPAPAHNGSVVVCDAVERIDVDGDLKDWASARRHPISLNLFGDPESSSDDCRAYFCVALSRDSKSLYMAVNVVDDSQVHHVQGHRTWQSLDSITLHVALPVSANKKDGDHDEVAFSSIAAVESKTAYSPTGYSGEFRFDVSAYAGAEGFDLRPQCAAFSVAVNDKDADGSFTVKFWSPEISKSVDPERRGDLVLSTAELGHVQGRRDDATGDHLGRLMLEFQAVGQPLLKVRLRTEPGGSYHLDLPPGEYLRTGEHLTPAKFRIRAGQQTVDALRLKRQQTETHLLSECELDTQAIAGYNQLLARDSSSGFYEMTKLNGLPESRIFALGQDRLGTLWIGTESYLARFDGSQLKLFDRDVVSSVRAFWYDAARQRLWFAGDQRVGYLDDQAMTTYPRLDHQSALCIGPAHSGEVCIGTKYGLYLKDDTGFQFHGTADGLPDERITALAVDRQRGVTWIGTNSGLAAWEAAGYHVYDQHDGLADPRIVSLFVDSRGVLWIGTASSLYCYDGAFHRIRRHPTERVSYARAFAELPNGNVVAGSYDGYLEIPPDARDQHDVVRRDSATIDSLLVDRDDQLWTGLELGALRRSDLCLQQVHAGTCGQVFALGEDIWFAELRNDAGGPQWDIVQMSKATHRVRRHPLVVPRDEKLKRPWVTQCLASADGILVGTKEHGVYQLEDGEWRWLELPSDSFSEIVGLTQGRDGRIWIVTPLQLYVLQDGSVRPWSVPDLPHEAALIAVSESPTGEIAVATSVGVFVVDENEQLLRRIDETTGLASNAINAMRYDREGTLWVATLHGLQGLSEAGHVRYSTQEGLLSDQPSYFVEEWAGEIWAGSTVGVNRVSLERAVVQQLVGNDGWGSSVVHDVAPDGEQIWLSGELGIWRYSRGEHAPEIRIDDVVTDESLGAQSPIKLSTDVHSVQLQFRAVGLKNRPGGMIYRYRFLGSSNDWVTTRKTMVTLPVPDVGDYTFEVCAIDRDLLVSEVARVDLHIRPPYLRLATQVGFVLASLACMVMGGLYFERARRERASLTASVRQQTAQLDDLERQLQQAQKMEALGTIASGVAHDFNNSLQAINCSVELALMNKSATEKDLLMADILAVTKQAAGLTKSMLMFGGKGASEKRRIDVRDAVGDSEKILRRTLPASIQFHVRLPSNPVYCLADWSQIQQVVLNLALNARDAMPQGGRLEISVNQAKDRVLLVVGDTGHGMSRQTQERIFEPFYTEKARGQGTGLGLSMVHAIVKDHDGSVSVDSAPGAGAQFTVALPATQSGEHRETSSSAAVVHGDGRILLADDEVWVRNTLATALSLAGFDVETVADGREFAARFREDSSFDLVILDVDMPHMTGWESLELARKQRSDVAAIMISGLPMQGRPTDPLTKFIRKPFSVRTVTDAVADLIKVTAVRGPQAPR